MMRWVLLALAAVVVIAGLALWKQSAPEPEPAPEAAAPVPPAETPSHYPVPEPEAATEAEAEKPLPQLDGSDADVRDALAAAVGREPVERFLLPKEFLRRLVALVDSLDRDPVPLQFRPMKHVEGVPAVQTQGDTLLLDPADASRYTGWVSALQAVDTDKLVAVYLRYYPLLQQAYVDLGYPGGYFNDRVVRIIDHLLATPEISEPIAVVRPKVLYVFADPELEERSWGQKALIRMRPENAAVVKAKLREIRARIAANEEKRPRD